MNIVQLFKWEKPNFHPLAWGIIIGTLFSRTVFFMTMPFIAIYLGAMKGIDPTTIGLIIGVSALMGTFGGFLGGNLSDRIGRFPVMLTAISVWVLIFVGFALAEQAWTFFLLSALNGLCRALFEPSGQALLADVTPQENRLSVFNARYAAINFGAAVGPLLGAYLGSNSSTVPFFITAFVYLLYGLALFFLYRIYRADIAATEEKAARGAEETKEKKTLRAAFIIVGSDKVFRFFLFGIILVNLTYSQMQSTLPLYLTNTPGISNGVILFSYIIFTNAVTVLILQYPLTRITKKYHPLASIKLGSIMFGTGLLGLGIFKEPIYLILSMIVFTSGEVLTFVMSSILIDRLAPPHLRGTYFGAAGLGSLGYSMGPPLGGFLLTLFGYGQGWLIFCILAGAAYFSLPLFQWGHTLEKRKRKMGPLLEPTSVSSSSE